MRPPFLYNQNNLYTILISSLLILTLSLYEFLYNMIIIDIVYCFSYIYY